MNLYLGGFLFFTGILLASSIGNWYPYSNLLGLVITGLGAYLLAREDK